MNSYRVLSLVPRACRKVLVLILRNRFAACGSRTSFDPFGSYSWSTISLGSGVFLGHRCVLTAPNSSITIGDKVMLGPCVMMIGGDHNTSDPYRDMADVKVKLPGDDLPIVVERNVWIGAGAIVLKGVTIGTGSIIAAGTVVTKDVPAYSVFAGVPGRVIRDRLDRV